MKRKTSTFVNIGIFAVLIATAIWFIQGNNEGAWMGNRWWGMGFHHMMGGSMGFPMIVFWIVLIVGFIALVTGMNNGLGLSEKDDDKMDRPLEILKKRYARGEIDKIEYSEKREDLLN